MHLLPQKQMKTLAFYASFLLIFSLIPNILKGQQPVIPFKSPVKKLTQQMVDEKLNSMDFRNLTGFFKKDSTTIDTIKVNVKTQTIEIYLDAKFAYAPFRENTVDTLKSWAHQYLGESYTDYSISFFSNKRNITDLIPNYYRTHKKEVDKKRIPTKNKTTKDLLVKNISNPKPEEPVLNQSYLALWHSHGYYFEQKLNRWEWQRARLFQTVEDISTLSYMLKYLTPMLENAGATVLLPRERDWQTNEVIVDNNGSQFQSVYREKMNPSKVYKGFGIGIPPYITENPFQLGTAQEFAGTNVDSLQVAWIPDIPEEGYYPVYVSYHASPANTSKALYQVYHSGGISGFEVNQQMGGGTWIYLGKFKFLKGVHEETGKVVLKDLVKKKGQRISADAVRFGGGMGNISRNGQISRKARYQEAARYYMQFSGIPDSLVWRMSNGKKDDYIDDYQCRGEWVNYLMGAPSGPKKDRNNPGLGIPIDLALALHTDAGIAKNDSIIGTLGIYSTTEESPFFPNGTSKLASRELTDMVQTQVVSDIRAKYDSNWTRRGMWDKPYSEAFRPNVPGMLLELYSHQNFKDVKLGQDPQFRFDVSRAIYKGILRYLCYQKDLEYMVQPLPVSHFRIELQPNQSFLLQWQPVADTLEPTAKPDGYIVYRQTDNQGFDNGTFVKKPVFMVENATPGIIYSFKVSAWNRGGESFPSEILSACYTPVATDKVLIVNGFDRLSIPASIEDSLFSGFLNFIDEGVDYQTNLSFTGTQFEFHRNQPWFDDDSPGHGASNADMENKPVPGNSFDFSYLHGKSIQQAGLSFASASDESVAEGFIQLANYSVVDFIAGEEKTTFQTNDSIQANFQIFGQPLIESIDSYLNGGGTLLISGSYIGSDVHFQKQDSIIGTLLKYKWRTDHASRMGEVYFCDSLFKSTLPPICFNTKYHPILYAAEAPDAIVPFDSTSVTFIRYAENNMSVGVLYKGAYKVIALGFPFETITDAQTRDQFMKTVLNFLVKK